MTEFVTGFKEIDKALKQFPIQVQKKALNTAVRKAARPIVKIAKQQVPVRTGAIKRNIKARKGKPKFNKDAAVTYLIGVEHGKVRRGLTETFQSKTRNRRGRLRKLSARERRGEDPFYFQWVETGFKHRGGKRVQARPFLRPAIRRGEGQATEVMRKELNKFIEDYERGK